MWFILHHNEGTNIEAIKNSGYERSARLRIPLGILDIAGPNMFAFQSLVWNSTASEPTSIHQRHRSIVWIKKYLITVNVHAFNFCQITRKKYAQRRIYIEAKEAVLGALELMRP